MAGLLEAAGGHGGIHVLHGTGGCGKTAVAQALFHSVTSRLDAVGLWVNASERATFRAGMLAVAADRGAQSVELASAYAGQRAAADLVWHYLDSSPQRWVLVLDNADDPAVLEEGRWLRASQQGTVVVTTRQGTSPVWQGAQLHRVGTLPVEDAALILRDLAPDSGTLEEARSMAQRLDCLPLALTLAGSFLSRQLLESWSMSDYQRRLEDDSTELIDRGADSEGDARHMVGRTWQISLDRLERAGAPESVTLMRLLSCFSSDPLPLALLHPRKLAMTDLDHATPSLKAQRVEVALRGLLDHSLVALVDVERGDVGVRCIRAHGVLLDSIAASVPDNQRVLLMTSAVRLLAEEFPEDLRAARAVGGVGWLAPHVVNLLRRVPDSEVTLELVELAVRLAALTFDMGDYHASSSVARSAAEAGQRQLGGDHHVTLRARHRLALALFRLGRFEESERLHRNVLEVRVRLLGQEHGETLASLQDIHEPLGQLGRLEDCVASLREVEAIRARILGSDHPDTLHVRALLIEYLANPGSEEEFDEFAPAAVAICEERLGDESFTTVTARHNFAYGLYVFGRWAQAEEVARMAVSDRERFHGAEHYLTLSAKVLLSWILEKRGRREEAVILARSVVEGQERVLGVEHPYVLANRASLAASLAASGRVAEAVALAARNLPLCERTLGPSDPVTVKSRAVVDELGGAGAEGSPLGQDGGPVERA
ncbi:tetratricopeptide repeat protein [Streptomyces sp. WMMC940]|uniref:tetratricopeptide repeat protein n=1 Tax=Streptomyces sp. WMMC940 TaxID=3015153 RepID=UPI0022B699C0|nr:tetratricopeptide repeat protein [Streptomyces sp. WMMC940]MCZ7459690.1 tetratricopeptide repeat protein [Streptomyces sp. WMMC940]